MEKSYPQSMGNGGKWSRGERGGTFNSRRGFSYDIRKANARPSNTNVSGISVLKDNKFGMIEGGVLEKD